MNAIVKFVDEAVKEFFPEKKGFKRSASTLLKEEPVSIWNKREEEPGYAKLRHQDVSDKPEMSAAEKARVLNVYDQPIDLIALVEESKEHETASAGQSLYINGNPSVGENPNRNKQHGFYFTADNCIGCHACESACAEKNETPAHLAFRSVGYVEGGSFPDFQRMNISMACNHCDDPVCLKGCPTLAYTKHTEYGAVLQDPDTCFGCGYCTWVCPYNAPQLDPVKGQVSKCNMCVDRLEVGLKPACVSACVGNALDFGVVEDIPENRDQAKTAIPGFPDPSISQPNIRFQQKKSLPEEMTRTDSAPIKYRFDEESQRYAPALDPKSGREKYWNLAKLSSRENPLVLFTLSVQAAMGAFLLYFWAGLLLPSVSFTSAANSWLLFVVLVFNSLGLLFSTTHLGKPMRFYRGFNNLRYSPVSREAFGVACFQGMVGCYWLLSFFPSSGIIQIAMTAFGVLATLSAFGAIYYMIKCYRIPARPFWNHWQTATAFFGAALGLGALMVAAVSLLTASSINTSLIAGMVVVACVAELIGLYQQAKDNTNAQHEGAASHYVQTTEYGKTYQLRNTVLCAVIVLGLLSLALPSVFSDNYFLGFSLWVLIALGLVFSELVSRALFYILVIPTTMPGAFFWRNKGFEEHAKEIGLNEVVDMGVVSGGH